jgi:hypothetical protein
MRQRAGAPPPPAARRAPLVGAVAGSRKDASHILPHQFCVLLALAMAVVLCHEPGSRWREYSGAINPIEN